MINFIFVVSLCLSVASAQDGSLGEALSQKKKTFTEKMPKEVVELYENNIKDLKRSGLEKQALKVGADVPEASIELNGKKHPLSQVYSRGPLVIKFYRGGWCPYCVMELKAYEKLHQEFKKAGAQILAFAPDTSVMCKKTQSLNNLSFDLLSDKDHSLARKFHLVYKLDQKVVNSLKQAGIDLSIYHESNQNELAIPATFVIDTEGKVAFSFVDADYRVRAEPSQVLEIVKKISKK